MKDSPMVLNKDVMSPLNNSFHEFTELIKSISDEQFVSPMHGWSPKGVASHLAGWNRLMIEAGLSILAGRTPDYYADAPNHYSTINAGFTTQYLSYSKAELLAELQSSMDSFEAFVLSLPGEELSANHGVHHYNGSPATVNKMIESLTSDYQDHTHELKEWLSEK
jgi:hypothetical protein